MAKSIGQRKRVSPEQIDLMVEFMTTHLCLVNPELLKSLPNRKEICNKLWEELSAKLNNPIFCPKKTTIKWKKAWSDLRGEVRKYLKRQKEGNDTLYNRLSYQKVASLLAKASSQQPGLSVSYITELEKDFGIKIEESNSYKHSEIKSKTAQPFVVSVQSLGKPPTETVYQSFVKCEDTAESDVLEPRVLIPYIEIVNSNGNGPSLEGTANSTMPEFNRSILKTKTKPERIRTGNAVTVDTQSRNITEERDTSDGLFAIGNAIPLSNENQEKLLKIEEERNRLIQQRNIIELERNDMFKSLIEHLKSKDIL